MLLISAITAAVSLALTAFWTAVRAFVIAAAEKIKQVLMGAAAEAVTLFVRRGTDGLKQLACNYINQGGHYLEKIVTKRVEESDLPSDIKSRVNNSYGREVDITNDFQRELQLS